MSEPTSSPDSPDRAEQIRSAVGVFHRPQRRRASPRRAAAPAGRRRLAGSLGYRRHDRRRRLGRAHALVLRRALGGAIRPLALSQAQEFRVYQAMYAAGVAVPRPYWLADGDEAMLGSPAFLMERIDGEAIGRRLVREPAFAQARGALPAQMAAQLARIHAVDLDALDFLPRLAPGQSPALAAIERLDAQLRAIGEPHPALEIGLRWLRLHAPPRPPGLGPWRFPHRQPDVRPRRAARGAGLGICPLRRPGRRHGLALRASLALRPRRTAPWRSRPSGAVSRGLRRRWRHADRACACVLLGSAWQPGLGRGRAGPGAAPPERPGAQRRARQHRPDLCRDGVGAAKLDRGCVKT